VTSQEELRRWIALNLAAAENPRAGRTALRRCGSVDGVFRRRREELTVFGFDKEAAAVLTSPSLMDKAERELERIRRKGYRVLTLEDERYPRYLKEAFDPPLILYCAGRTEVLNEPAVSVVGARKPTPYGRAVAERLARDLASRGLVVVSGMARGIDSIAHWGALKGGRTIAVLGSGFDRLYPRENRGLFEKILEEGAVLSEYPLETPPLGFHFPLRNRIIAGLSLALVVVEAARKSGSLISARLALEMGREVMAVPGNVTSDLSRGTNWLIKEGAKPVEDWRDVVEELPPPHRDLLLDKAGHGGEETPPLRPEEEALYRLLDPDRLISVDELVDESGLSVSEVLALLLSLELKDLVAPGPGKRYQRKL